MTLKGQFIGKSSQRPKKLHTGLLSIWYSSKMPHALSVTDFYHTLCRSGEEAIISADQLIFRRFPFGIDQSRLSVQVNSSCREQKWQNAILRNAISDDFHTVLMLLFFVDFPPSELVILSKGNKICVFLVFFVYVLSSVKHLWTISRRVRPLLSANSISSATQRRDHLDIMTGQRVGIRLITCLWKHDIITETVLVGLFTACFYSISSSGTH